MFKIVILFLAFSVVNNHVLIPKSFNDYYFSLKPLTSKPMFRYVDNSEYNAIPDNYVYKFVTPNKEDYDVIVDKDINIKDYVVVKSKNQPLDLGPYDLIRRLDEIKYMVLWLNLYCSTHPDCDKMKLNEELKKVSSVILFYSYFLIK